MRKLLILGAVLLLAGGATWAGSGVLNSVHDFSTGSSGVAATAVANEDQVCKFCHAPHNNAAGLTSAPLWNHGTQTTATYGTYDSDTFNGSATIADIGTGDNSSWLCMSCHDGTVAVGQLQNAELIDLDVNANLNASDQLIGTLNMGTAMANDHPVNFDAQAAATADGSVIIAAAYPLNQLDIMHCSTCHDPHDGAATGTNGKLLRGSTTDSAICRDCHVDK